MRQVIIVGGGKSIREEWLNNGLFDNLKGQEVWSLNYAFMTMPYLPTKQLWVDRYFYEVEGKHIRELHEKGVPLISQRTGIIPFPEMIRKVEKFYNKTTIYQDQLDIEDAIFTGQFSLGGLFALGVAVKEKVDRIFLLGYDWGNEDVNNKDTHYYDGYIKHHSKGAGHPDLYKHINSNEPISKVHDFQVYENYKEAEIYNVSLKSNIPYLPKISYQEMYKKLEEDND